MINKLQNKKICLLGFGIENKALIEFLIEKKIDCKITICDARKNIVKKYKNIKYCLDKNYYQNLTDFDIIFRIAGCPLFLSEIKKAKKAGIKISSPTKLFFELCPTKNIIGVAGTKGKGTTSALIYKIIKASGKRVFFGGNIGIPMFSFFQKIKKNDWVVLELSSFQLEDLTQSPKIAVITNFSKEHLAPADPNNPNYHKTLKSYWEAKINIIKYQNKKNYAILNNKFKITNSKKTTNSKLQIPKTESKIIYFNKSKLPSRLIGEHNKENIAAAVEVAKIIKIKKNIIEKAVANFKGLEHRLEFVKIIKGIKYYNDSFATTPEAAITALKSFNNSIILLAGGSDKGSDFKKLAKEIKKKVKFIVLFKGEATKRLKNEILKTRFLKNRILQVNDMKKAVKIAQNNSEKDDIILLSPACASFGIFKNYKERGELFKKYIKIL
ncbi:MAG: UDP-N-acetylmuramoyl-L-alanine--D-glutamate ligase [Patescibacteria group bacterium]|nr:UDP-N-acetylmuramoyl-L-alanine--D-glutamate ligase [Patescibacteria group bacterium]